jgi:hypothetical protein
MNMANTHIIRKASVNFTFSGKDDGAAVEQAVTSWCRNVLSPSIDSALKKYEMNGIAVKLDKLSIDVDLNQAGDWTKVLTEMIIEKITEKVDEEMTHGNHEKEIPRAGNFSGIMSYYLDHGFLPWNAGDFTHTDFESAADRWLKSLSPEEIKNLLLKNAGENQNRRLIHLLKADDLEKFIVVSYGLNRESTRLLFSDIFAVFQIISDSGSDNLNLFRRLGEKLLSGVEAIHDEKDFIRKIAEWASEMEEDYPGRFRQIPFEKLQHPGLKKIISAIGQSKPSDKKPKPGRSSEPREDRHNGTRDSGSNENSHADPEFIEGVFINNAGAIIISPFLGKLFQRTGLATESLILDPSGALNLLHYCITGNTAPHDFELLLPKILCGLPSSFIPVVDTIPDDKMLAEADDMLTSAIGHWSVLKDTTPTGLRESFLLRNGRLSSNDEEWLLVVEQKPYDMLLEQIPWNIGMIKLPWMKNLLRTQWI